MPAEFAQRLSFTLRDKFPGKFQISEVEPEGAWGIENLGFDAVRSQGCSRVL